MDFNEYQNSARQTAIYSDMGNNILYPTLGLISESGEFIGKIKKMLRDDNSKMTPDRRLAIKGELGDILWYIANICTEAGLDLGCLYDLINKNHGKPNNVYLLSLRLHQQVSNIVMLVEKSVYGIEKIDLDPLTPLSTDIAMLLELLDEICLACALQIDRVAEYNIEKLSSRFERGVIQGDGDNR